MTKPKNDDASISKRHLTGFRRFQNAALRALSLLSASLLPAPKGSRKKKAEPSLKVSDMKSLVSTYKEAVLGERSVLGLSDHKQEQGQEQWPEEMVIRWEDPDGGGEN